MRNLTVFMLASIVTLAGCDLLKRTPADAGATVVEVEAGVPPATSPPVVAANSAAVARFPSETAVSEGRVIASQTTPRVSPKSGAIVSTLKVGTEVTRVATNGTDSLITFQDPVNPTVTLMGWVTDAAFTATIVPKKIVDAGVDSGVAVAVVVDAGPPAVAVVDAGTPKIEFACKPGESAIFLNGKAQCKKTCVANKDCKNNTCSSGLSPKNVQVKVCLSD